MFPETLALAYRKDLDYYLGSSMQIQLYYINLELFVTLHCFIAALNEKVHRIIEKIRIYETLK